MNISSVEPQMTVHVFSKGSLPSNYRSIEHIVLDNNKSVFTDKLTNLTTDQDYFVQVSAFNFLGYSSPRASVPIFLSPLKQKPSAPEKVHISLHTGQSIKVLFYHPESDGGDLITRYRIEWDISPTFDSKKVYRLDHIQKL